MATGSGRVNGVIVSLLIYAIVALGAARRFFTDVKVSLVRAANVQIHDAACVCVIIDSKSAGRVSP